MSERCSLAHFIFSVDLLGCHFPPSLLAQLSLQYLLLSAYSYVSSCRSYHQQIACIWSWQGALMFLNVADTVCIEYPKGIMGMNAPVFHHEPKQWVGGTHMVPSMITEHTRTITHPLTPLPSPPMLYWQHFSDRQRCFVSGCSHHYCTFYSDRC